MGSTESLKGRELLSSRALRGEWSAVWFRLEVHEESRSDRSLYRAALAAFSLRPAPRKGVPHGLRTGWPVG